MLSMRVALMIWPPGPSCSTTATRKPEARAEHRRRGSGDAGADDDQVEITHLL